MDRRQFIPSLLAAVAIPLIGRPGSGVAADSSDQSRASLGFPRLSKPKSEWKKLLTRAEYDILFEADTERPFSHALNDEKRKGTYVCKACFLPLFTSAMKFESGTGWPSFWAPLRGRVGLKTDYKLIYPRTEYHCIRCGGHQGHVFNDGPRPTGQRWCNNGLALRFIADEQALPALRT